MNYMDKTLECVGCGKDFVFSADEQEFFASKGFENEPKRCPVCREARRQGIRNSGNGWSGGPSRERQRYSAICAACGQETEVPFEPKDGRPVYCSPCFAKVRQ